MSTTYVAYYRVSTQKQGMSGLGLEAHCQILAPQEALRADSTQPTKDTQTLRAALPLTKHTE